ncbi:putative gypsy-type retrotransposon [Panicum miliaceum]|uniref:Gypsy-type retrotransposon n=1 Tax=Panicum miliaceum TaxID=4540 RepID=A0A3L6Q323_PANMI|nr:putative gypsy-type retrotransposon [Panicum miliaceum]
MTYTDIEALVAQGLVPEKGTPDVVGGAAFSLCQGGKYPEASFKDNNKRWVEEWFIVVNPAPSLPPRTGLPSVLNARWEEKPTDEEKVEVEVLLAELQKLKAEKLTGTTVALSFAKRLTQQIQERVHPGFALPAADVGSYSSIGSESDDIAEVSVQVAGASSTTKKRRPTHKVAASKAQRGGVTPRGRSSTPPCASRVRTEAAVEKADLATPKSEEEDQGEERGRPTRSPARVAQSLLSAAPLKPSFSVQRAGRRASLSGAKRKAEESTRAKGEVVASEPPLGDDVSPLEVATRDRAKGGVVEDPVDPNAVPQAIAPVLTSAQEPPEENAPGEEAVVTKEALALADLSRRAASQLEAGDGSAGRVLQLEEELQALKRHHYEALKK